MKKFIAPLSIISILLIVGLGLFGYGKYIEAQDIAKAESMKVQTANTAPTHPATVEELLAGINTERAKAGVAPLTIDPAINATAQRKAHDMVSKHYYGHVDPNGEHGYTYMLDAGVKCLSASENLVAREDMAGTMTAKAAVASWMDSKPHREALLDPKYTTTGFGVEGWTVVEHFCQAA